MVFLETNRLVLRQLRITDADSMHDYRNNELCSRYQRGQTKDFPGIRQLIQHHRNDEITDLSNWIAAVALKESDEMVGEIVVMPNDGCFSLGYTFSYKHHRNGYAYEALSALISKLHEQYPEMEFISFVEPENIASITLLKKLGYTDYGYIPKMTSNIFGKWVREEPLK